VTYSDEKETTITTTLPERNWHQQYPCTTMLTATTNSAELARLFCFDSKLDTIEWNQTYNIKRKNTHPRCAHVKMARWPENIYCNSAHYRVTIGSNRYAWPDHTPWSKRCGGISKYWGGQHHLWAMKTFPYKFMIIFSKYNVTVYKTNTQRTGCIYYKGLAFHTTSTTYVVCSSYNIWQTYIKWR